MNSPDVIAPELTIVRTFRAPRPLVWRAWADPKQIIKWMGPRHHPATYVEGDFCPGGSYRRHLTSSDGSGDLFHGGVYREIVEPERLVFTFAWEDDDGKPENEMLITITFEEVGAETKMTFHQTGFRAAEQCDGHQGGWTSTFDRLEEFLARN